MEQNGEIATEFCACGFCVCMRACVGVWACHFPYMQSSGCQNQKDCDEVAASSMSECGVTVCSSGCLI